MDNFSQMKPDTSLRTLGMVMGDVKAHALFLVICVNNNVH